MKTIKHAVAMALFLSSAAVVDVVFAAGNLLQAVTAQPVSVNKTELRLQFNAPVTPPKGEVLENPPRLVFDFPGTEVSPTSRQKIVNMGKIQAVEAAGNKGKARVVVRMQQLVNYTVEVRGNAMIMVFDAGTSRAKESLPKFATSGKATTAGVVPELPSAVVLPEPPKALADPSYKWYVPPTGHAAQPAPATPVRVAPTPVAVAAPPVQAARNMSELRGIDFRREPDGGARIVLELPSADTKVNENKRGNAVTVSMMDVDVPKHLQQRMDVLDFGTPVTEVDVAQRDMGARILISAREGFTHRTQRRGNEYTVFIDKAKVISPAEKLTLGEKKKKTFTGEKLSLNFQDIEVRAVLQLLADFTNKNIVVSDTVQGNITVRLKDVPWDQALDIVLESKNLGMRENGNVIWVAPAPELESKEKQEMEAIKAKQELEPLVTEYIAINFAKAVDLEALIHKGKTDDKQSLLSPRGTVSVDERTNTLLVKDTISQVESIRDLVKTLDVPVQQVLIESRIVTANDEFGKELGARFGVTPKWINKDSVGIGSLNGSDKYYTSIAEAAADETGKTPITIPGLNDRLSVNLPVVGAAGKFGFSLLSKDFMVDLELSALQAESKGEIISTPKVMTSNQTKATIEQGVEIPYQEASASGATSVSFKKAVLSMEVTPQITPDEHISMDLKVNQDTVGQVFAGVPSINTREIQTKVLVENGQTVVLGGVHEEENLRDTTKVPVLGDVPVLGRLFRTDRKSNDKRELLIFVTPKIVDGKS
ncbi:type IV pilus secretin PilQ [Candidatus Thiothrix anitrata]|uniref:Type IV pilus secretin PilQ n=1 Tax=Candidatus Thiothrix anitrata TaxID=2823902 RepID=A0ABX7X1Y3_9GAMM|nr:type IV pilus secretin PilQ [Candidatus Thiothrix anitrata]QTR49944.1 type IV pilus secretin PilQ [Candidatus Thiothrix anitrata]